MNQQPKTYSEKTCQEINEQDGHDANLKQSSKHKVYETLTSKIHKFLSSKHLPQGELCVLQISKNTS